MRFSKDGKGKGKEDRKDYLRAAIKGLAACHASRNCVKRRFFFPSLLLFVFLRDFSLDFSTVHFPFCQQLYTMSMAEEDKMERATH